MSKIYKVITLFFLFNLPCLLNGQNEFSKWYFGFQAGINFNPLPPTSLSSPSMIASEGVASICDASGNLLFYTNGVTVYNSTHAVMANGTNLFGHMSTTQSAIIVKQPGNTNFYYIFTADAIAGANGLCYSIVDMTMAAGQGSVTIKNTNLYSPTCEKLVAVRHCNGRDVWIVSHHYGTNEFRSYLLTSSGVSASPAVSAIGETPAGGGSAVGSTAGQIKISPDGKKIAMATATNSIPNTLGGGGFFLFDFDAATGIVSNSLTLIGGTNLPTSTSAYGLEFSSNGTKVYGSTSPTGTLTGALFQWDLCLPTGSAITMSQYSLSLTGQTGSLQRAIDGKIYMALSNTQSLNVINNPNATGNAMNFVYGGLSIAPGQSQFGLPNYINPWTKAITPPFSNTIACQKVSFAVPPVPTFSSGCNSTPYVPSSYLWDFGEQGSGIANSSTLTTPVHTYSTTGTYSVSLILYSNCTNDTLKQVVTVTTPGPTLSVSGPSVICKGDKKVYTASGGSVYAWSNNSSGPTATLSPTQTAVYTASATLNGCTSSKQFTVTVDPCIGIHESMSSDGFRIFPNPVKDLLSVQAVVPSQVMIFDMNGSLILETKINSGHNEIDMSRLKGGIYFIEAKDGESVWRRRVVKME